MGNKSQAVQIEENKAEGGATEARAGHVRRRANLNKALLGTLQVSGLLAVALLVPNALKSVPKSMMPKPFAVRRAVTRLRNGGYIEFVADKRGKARARLTSKGRLKLIRLGSAPLERPRRWDGKWRIVAFDIPEKRKKARDEVRRFLAGAGFYRLQDSMWVYPFDCEEVITMLKVDFKIGSSLLYIVAEAIENDKHLRARYGIAS